MDAWSHLQVLSMLEGGNDQLSGFFVRHSLSPRAGNGVAGGEAAAVAAAAAAAAAAVAVQAQPRPIARSNSCNAVDEIVARRYKTKAALFYRENLAKHVEQVAADGQYKGREAARKRTSSSSKGGTSKPPSPSGEPKSKALKSAGNNGELPPIQRAAAAAAPKVNSR